MNRVVCLLSLLLGVSLRAPIAGDDGQAAWAELRSGWGFDDVRWWRS